MLRETYNLNDSSYLTIFISMRAFPFNQCQSRPIELIYFPTITLVYVYHVQSYKIRSQLEFWPSRSAECRSSDSTTNASENFKKESFESSIIRSNQINYLFVHLNEVTFSFQSIKKKPYSCIPAKNRFS